MVYRAILFLAAFLAVFLLLPCLNSRAGEVLLEDQDIYGDYLVIGDRVLLKNPFSSVERLSPLPKGYDTQWGVWWEEDKRLTYMDTSHALGVAVAVKDNYVHVGWSDDRIHRTFRIFYKRSSNLGHSWEEEVLLSDTLQVQWHVYFNIASSTNYLHAVWGYSWKPISEQGHIYYRRSLDDGATWENTYYLSSYDMQSKPSIATLGDTVYVIFSRTIYDPHGPDIPELHFRKSCDEGATWTDDRKIGDYYPECTDGVLRANEAGLHYVFQHKDNFDDPGNPYRSQEIFYIHSVDWGATWTDPLIVSHRDSMHSQWPSMCLDDRGTIHVTWFDYKYSPYSESGDVFHTTSVDNGQSWSTIEILVDSHTALTSRIISGSDHLHLLWEDERNESNNFDIFYKHSPDRGISWEGEQRLTDVCEDSYYPDIAEQDDTLYAVWADKRHDPTNRRPEIYFKRGIVGATTVSESPPTQYSLYLTSYPNPFNERVTLQYGIAGDYREQRVLLKIYNVRGQLVRTILDSDLASGDYRSVWDGTDSKETRVSSGVYLCVLQGEHDRRLSRLLYLK